MADRQALAFGYRPFKPRRHGSEPGLPGRLTLRPRRDGFAPSRLRAFALNMRCCDVGGGCAVELQPVRLTV